MIDREPKGEPDILVLAVSQYAEKLIQSATELVGTDYKIQFRDIDETTFQDFHRVLGLGRFTKQQLSKIRLSLDRVVRIFDVDVNTRVFQMYNQVCSRIAMAEQLPRDGAGAELRRLRQSQTIQMDDVHGGSKQDTTQDRLRGLRARHVIRQK